MTYPGAKAFHLYETFGLPLDFMVDAARDPGMEFDLTGFEAARARRAGPRPRLLERRRQKIGQPRFRDLPKTDFEGYTQLVRPTAKCSPS